MSASVATSSSSVPSHSTRGSTGTEYATPRAMGILAKARFRDNDVEGIKPYLLFDPQLRMADYKRALEKGHLQLLVLLAEKGYFHPDTDFLVTYLPLITEDLLQALLTKQKYPTGVLNLLMEESVDRARTRLWTPLARAGAHFPLNTGLVTAQTNPELIPDLVQAGYRYTPEEMAMMESMFMINEFQLVLNMEIKLIWEDFQRGTAFDSALQQLDQHLRFQPQIQLNSALVFNSSREKMIPKLVKAGTLVLFQRMMDLPWETLEVSALTMVVKHSATDAPLQLMLQMLRVWKPNAQMYYKLRDSWLRRFESIYPIYMYQKIQEIKIQKMTQLGGIQNDETLTYLPFEDILEDENQGFMIRLNDYAFSLPELFSYWRVRFNGYDHLILPSYPDNPYTRAPINGLILYAIGYLALERGKELPLGLRILLLNPRLLSQLEGIWKDPALSKDDKNYESTAVFRHFLQEKGFSYTGGNPEENEAGEWKTEGLPYPQNELYEQKMTTDEILTLLLQYGVVNDS